jgi:hypothetical protein
MNTKTPLKMQLEMWLHEKKANFTEPRKIITENARYRLVCKKIKELEVAIGNKELKSQDLNRKKNDKC